MRIFPFIFFLFSTLIAQEIDSPGQAREKHKQKIWDSFSKLAVSEDRSSYNVSYYRIELEISFEPNLLRGSVLTRFNVLADGLNQIIIDLDDALTVDAISGPVQTFNHSDRKLQIDLAQTFNSGDDLEIVISYSGLPDPGNNRWFVFDRLGDGSHHVWTLSEPYGAKYWWPCKDTPRDKADSVDIIVTVPENQIVASNGMLRSNIENRDGTRTFHWHESYPIATYLVSLAIAPYAHFTDSYMTENGQELLLDYYVYPTRENLARAIFPMVKDHMKGLTHYFGPYPFPDEKYGMAQFGWPGGMEHQTISSIGAVSEGWEYIYVHELAHQWFGDALSCDSWTEIWLNEGFASYSEALYAEWAGFNTWAPGPKAYQAYINTQRYVGPGTLIVKDTTLVSNIFASIVYDKGSWVMHMLRYVLGDADFFDSLKEYASDPQLQYGTVSTEDFKNVCERISGMQLDAFFDQWLNYPYFPNYSYSFETVEYLENNKYLVKTLITQDQNQTVYEMPIELKFIFESGQDTMIRVYNDRQKQQFDIILNEVPFQLVLDPDNWILKQARDRSAGPFSSQIKIEMVYPNPAKKEVNIRLRSWNQGRHEIVIFNTQGQEIDRISPYSSSITHEFLFKWNAGNILGRSISAGIYFLKPLLNGKLSGKTRKVVILK